MDEGSLQFQQWRSIGCGFGAGVNVRAVLRHDRKSRKEGWADAVLAARACVAAAAVVPLLNHS